jgi:hypothetical protein
MAAAITFVLVLTIGFNVVYPSGHHPQVALVNALLILFLLGTDDEMVIAPVPYHLLLPHLIDH